MEDTDREIRDLQQSMWMQLSEEDRLRRCGELFALAKSFAWHRAPRTLSPDDKRRFVFNELYGFELPKQVNGLHYCEWLDIKYSGFWDYPFTFAVTFKNTAYLFCRGQFDEDVDEYPSEYIVFLRNDIDTNVLQNNFTVNEGGEVVGRVDMKQIKFDPSHREQIYSDIFRKINHA